jgi:DNA-binding transcriptional ArsR family regulator
MPTTTIARDSRLDSTFAALADPTRRAILARLSLGEASVTELASPFEMTLPAVSKHLKVLERAGLITRGREAQWRPCKLKADPLKDVAEWVEKYRQNWEESFSRLDDYLKTMQVQEVDNNTADDQPQAGQQQQAAQRNQAEEQEEKE